MWGNSRNFNTMVQIVVDNRDATPTNVCYIQIEVVSASGGNDSTFRVEVDGFELS